MDILLAPENRPFAVAAALMIGIVGLETLMLLIGLSISDYLEHSFGLHGGHDGHSGGGLNWLNVGGVPLLALLILALGVFAAAGFAVQAAARTFASPLPAWAAGLAAVAIGLPIVRVSTRWVARIVPRDETYAVELGDLVGSTALVSRGPLDTGLPGSVRLKDRHGNWHTLRARAARGEPAMPTGSTVLLVDHAGGVFTAVPAPPDLRA